jgi:hypothetical protein
MFMICVCLVSGYMAMISCLRASYLHSLRPGCPYSDTVPAVCRIRCHLQHGRVMNVQFTVETRRLAIVASQLSWPVGCSEPLSVVCQR